MVCSLSGVGRTELFAPGELGEAARDTMANVLKFLRLLDLITRAFWHNYHA